MNKAQVKLELNELITIDNTVYHVAEHPALPGVPYIQRGARGFVIQLKSPGPERYALKYFKVKYRVPELVQIGKALRQYSDLPGMRAAFRTVFTQETHPSVIRKYPALEYGVLMPWLPGITWFDIMTKRSSLAAQESVRLAQQMARVLANLEAQGLAHCDIAGANVMVDRKAGRVELVDIEEMYGAALPKPVEYPAGQEGYQHRESAQNGQWTRYGDRFGGAVIIAEMLAWQNQRMRDNSADEHFFAAAESQQPDTPRFHLMMDFLRGEFGPEIAGAFEQTWKSRSLADCPPMVFWADQLGKLQTDNLASAPRTSEVVSGRRTLTVTPPSAIAARMNAHASEGNGADPATTANTSETRLVNSVNPAPIVQGTQPIISAKPEAVPVATKLCPRCGAANMVGAEFCIKCHYYLKGDKRPAQAAPYSGRIIQSGATLNPTNPNANRVASGNVTKEVIAARRMVGPGQTGQTVPNIPPEPQLDGRGIVIAVIIGFVLMLLLFVAVLPR